MPDKDNSQLAMLQAVIEKSIVKTIRPQINRFITKPYVYLSSFFENLSLYNTNRIFGHFVNKNFYFSKTLVLFAKFIVSNLGKSAQTSKI